MLGKDCLVLDMVVLGTVCCESGSNLHIPLIVFKNDSLHSHWNVNNSEQEFYFHYHLILSTYNSIWYVVSTEYYLSG